MRPTQQGPRGGGGGCAGRVFLGKGEAVHWPQHSSRGSVLDAWREGRGRFRRIQTLHGGGGRAEGWRREGFTSRVHDKKHSYCFNNVFGVSEKVLRSSLCSSSFQQLTGCGRGVSQVGLKKGEGGEVS